MKRILFFAESVTLAHVARPLVLADSLDPSKFEPILACHPRYRRFFDSKIWQILPLDSIGTKEFLESLARGRPVYGVETLRRYVDEDLALIRQVRPDLIVGDFRLSLSISARLARIPYVAVTNAYWSPHCVEQGFPLPRLPMTRVVPIAVAEWLFRMALPLAMRIHSAPLNTVRAENGLPTLGSDLRRIYTDADHVLYADIPGLFPMRRLPANHHFVGPLLWSPPVAKPDWWELLPQDRPVIYVTLGSSGDPRSLRMVLEALGELPVTVMASTAGSGIPQHTKKNIFLATYLPGIEAAHRSALVICNGGSPTSQQALAAGVPVLSIASNADQFLNATALVAVGSGAMLRADRLSHIGVTAAVQRLLSSPTALHAARRAATECAKFTSPLAFVSLAQELCPEIRRASSK